MPFKKYRKIHRLGAEENEGILNGKVLIQEKIDGANTSIWLEDGMLKCGTRTQLIQGENTFNGFVEYVSNNTNLMTLFQSLPNLRLYGEWLVRHTIAYKETAYRQWYLFDIEQVDADPEKSFYLRPDEVYEIANAFGLLTPQSFGVFENPTIEQINEFVGKTNLGEKGEGVVLKNFGFVNKFGDQEYAKVVTQDFKEKNGLVFGGNNKHSDTYWEMYVVNQYMTLPRVQKVMNKLQPLVDKKLGMEHTARVIQTAYHDMITEEAWDIIKKVPKLDFKQLGKLATRKAAIIYHDILNEHISIAYATKNPTT